MIVGGKSIVVVGDIFSCGLKYLKIFDLVVMSSGVSSLKIVFNNINSFVVEFNFKYG